MVDKSVFLETLKDVAEIVRTSAEPMSKEEILSYFKDMELNKEQENMVLQYILTPHEDDDNEPAEPENEEESNDDTKENVEDSKVLQMYLEEISAIPSYCREDMENMYDRLFDGDSEVIKELANAWLIKVVEISRKNDSSSIHVEDLIQEGNVGLFMALTNLCGNGRKDNVEELIENAVEAAIKSYISEDLGEEDIENAILGKVSLLDAATKYLAGENGREPSVYELSEYTKMSLEEIDDVMSFMKIAEENSKDKNRK